MFFSIINEIKYIYIYFADINVTTYPSDSSELSYYRFLMVDPVANRLFVGSM